MSNFTRKNINRLFTFSLLFLNFFCYSQTKTFTASGTFIVPAGVTSIQIEAWGGGAGGKSAPNTKGFVGGGGGGGAYAKRNVVTVVPGTTYTITAPGAGGTPNNAGEASTLTINGVTITAAGGSVGSAASLTPTGGLGGTTIASLGDLIYPGGTGGVGFGNGTAFGSGAGGGGASAAGSTGAGNNGADASGPYTPGAGGTTKSSFGGAGGSGGNNTSGTSANTIYGGGGGGGGDRSTGGSGMYGAFIISWTCPTYSLTTTTVTTPICTSNTTNVSMTALAPGLPEGIYIVTYNLSSPNSATGNTANMTVTNPGVGNFFTSTLLNSGATVLTITNLLSGAASPSNCSSVISSNNTATITVNTTPTITSTAPGSRNGSGTVSLGATASSGTISWFSASSGGTALGTGTTWTTPSISTTTTFYAETTYGTCTSSTRTAVVATVNLPEINLLGNTVSIIDGDTTPSTLNWTIFGSMETSTGMITKTYTIQNTGNGTLTIGAITISGTNASDFSVSTSPSSSVIAGGSTTFSIRFDPITIGLKTANISIINNDSNENPYDFYIQGTGIQTFFDSDGDGIYDNFDIDDDNDGILDTTEEANCNSANGPKVDYKFLSETFGTGGRTSSFTAAYNATTSYCYEDGIAGSNTATCPSQSTWILDDGEYTVVSKITGTVAGDPENIHGDLAWYNGEDHTSGDTNGRMAVFNASFTPGTFYETTITGILSNLPITYSFWVLNIMASSTFPGSILPNVTVEFYDLSNNLLTSFNTGDIGRCSGSSTNNTCSQGVWKQFTTNVNLGNVNAFTIRFKNNAPGGGGNDLALDDILISQTLCDLDNDGVADVFDLDADNDGIADITEAGLGSLSNGKGKIDVAWVDTNGNGLHDSAEDIAALPALDSDGDGIPNYIDLDSDNDSLFDIDESGAGNTNAILGFVNGDGDINGDGKGDGPESEIFRSKDINGDGIIEGFGDGILDIYDYGTGATNQYGNLGQGLATGNPDTTYLKDTDGDGIPDYLDLTSNGTTFDIATTLLIYNYKTLDTNNDGIIDGTTDIDKDGILDVFDTNTAQFGSPRDLRSKLFLDFDGRNDYGQSTAILGGLANASLMAWVDLNSSFLTDGVIIGQNNFQIRITAAKKLEVVVNGTVVSYAVALNTSQWYNVGATYDGANIKLYLNGALVATQAKTGSIAADSSLLTLGKDPSTNSKYFKGKIDEIKVFSCALTDSQLQRMVYQEIQDNDSQIRGAVVPKNIATSPASLAFTNLLRYYRMDTYKNDIIDDLTTTAIDVTGTKIYNHKHISLQQAPMPFLTERTGSFATAVNSPTKEVKGNDIMEQNWSIVKVQHDITETANTTDLGMIVDLGKNIVMNNDTKIQNDWYLKLDGKIDLVGMSQLVQTTDSDLDVTSSGSIERDQQGQSNKYNYNYWSSPVSPINSVSNNTDYSITGVMKDGGASVPQNISWVGGYDGSPTSPITLARYWLYKFDNYGNAYANWSRIAETATIRVGQGFTMKGSGTLSATQNYTFVGKPNNGTITSNSVTLNQLLLTGNPYPSALDANAFINDNAGSIDGTLYFWEHYTTNDTHVLRDYQGGYAQRNLTGGVPPTSSGVLYISGSGATTRGIPNQYIPVGQSFFVAGNASSGGTVVYQNSQRGFHKENENGVSNIMFKSTVPAKNNVWNNNHNDSLKKDTYKRIRLGYNSSQNYHRQLLIGFMEQKATDNMDYGYDGVNFDGRANDMYFINGANLLTIQGVGYFDKKSSYPLGVKSDIEGKVIFMIDGVENFDENEKIFIFDSKDNTYHNIRENNYEVLIPVGVCNDRFSLCFKQTKEKEPKEKELKDKEHKKDSESENIKVTHIHDKNILKITDIPLLTSVEKVILYNMLGQSIAIWEIDNQMQEDIELPIKSLSSGVYILQLQTTNGSINRKIIVP